MAHKFSRHAGSSVHRIDLTCEQNGFRAPPADIHLKMLPPIVASGSWTLLAHSAAGRPSKLLPWLQQFSGIEDIRIEPGLAPKFMRARMGAPFPAWVRAAAFVKVHHVDVGTGGQCSWYVEGPKPAIEAFVAALEKEVGREPVAVRCRPVQQAARPAPLSRRQFEALASAISLGYYDIPHRVSLRTIASRTGTSLGAMSELLRRAEAAVLSHYVDASLMGWPPSTPTPPNPFVPVAELVVAVQEPERTERTAKAR